MTITMMTSAAQAVADIPDGSRIYVEGGAAHPDALVRALVALAAGGQRAFDIVTSVLGPVPEYCRPEQARHFRVISFRGSRETMDAYRGGQLDVVPAGLSRIPDLLSRQLRPDVALIQVSPPDPHGWCSLGVSVLYHRAAIAAARLVIAQVNPEMPATCGDSALHVSAIHRYVDADEPLTEFPAGPADPAQRAAAAHAAAFVPDGATVQVGMGSFADAVLAELAARRGLRVHAGLLSDGIVDLIAAGAVADAPGAVTVGAMAATRKGYRAADRNPAFRFCGVEQTHDPRVLAGLPGLVAINSALEVDYDGQSNGDTARGVPVSGAGGALDFAHAATAGGGLSILALPAVGRSGRRRVRPDLSAPAVVSVPRTEVDIIATEHGAVDLRGASLRERRELIASVAGEGTS
jgi:4-hydroxybutyrate CoA-transferase